MYSNKSNYDYGQKRLQSSRGSKPWGNEDGGGDWIEPQRNSTLDPYDKYDGEGQNWSERVGRSDHSEPYTREYNSDTDWRNEQTTSHEGSAPEKRWRTVGEDQYSCQREPEDRQSPEKYPQRNTDFKRQYPENSHFTPYKEDSHYRPVTEYYGDRDSRERSWSTERRRSPLHSKSYTPPRSRSDSFSRDHDEHNHNRSRFSLNGSSRLLEPSYRRFSPPPPPPPPPPPMSKGFQRFLDVLNMGVNVDTLKHIVTQGSPDVNVRQSTSTPHADRSWTSEQRANPNPHKQQNPQYWPQNERSPQRPTSQLPKAYSSNGKAMSQESSLDSHHFERKRLSPTTDPKGLDKEHKHKQVHDVLQAIGIKMGFEELGEMSSRIQERLYGKKQTDSALSNRKEEEEGERRRSAYAPKRRSRSSSGSGSSSSSHTYKRSHPYDDHRGGTDDKSREKQQNTSKYSTQVTSSTTQHGPNPKTPPVPMPSHVVPPPIPPFMNFPPPFYPSLPPTFPPAMANMFMPQMPPFFPPFMQTPPFPSAGIFPPATPLLQHQNNIRRHNNLVMVPPSVNSNVLNAQKAKNEQKRHRYLQHVETTQ